MGEQKVVIHVSILEKVVSSIESALRSARFDLRGNRKACLLLYLSALENSHAFVDLSQKPYAFASIANAGLLWRHWLMP